MTGLVLSILVLYITEQLWLHSSDDVTVISALQEPTVDAVLVILPVQLPGVTVVALIAAASADETVAKSFESEILGCINPIIS